MTEPDPKESPADPTDLPAVASKLITTIGELTRAIQMLMDRAEASERKIAATEKKIEGTEELAQANTRRVKKNERRAHAIRVLVVVDILFTVMGFALGYSLVATNARLDTVCPLFAFTIGTYAPQSRTAGPGRDQYIQSFGDMRVKFQQLGCGPEYPIVPGAAHPPTAAPPN